MSRRHVSIAATIGLFVALTAAACTTPAPEPTPTPTGFATEAEAFAAAEATYRAYVDALNAVDLSDPATFEPVYELTTGEASAQERESLSEMHANGWVKSGPTVVVSVVLQPPESASEVVLHACLDVSGVSVTNATGESVVANERPDQQSVGVRLVHRAEAVHGAVIADLFGLEESACQG